MSSRRWIVACASFETALRASSMRFFLNSIINLASS
jgi:hypothetical protein